MFKVPKMIHETCKLVLLLKDVFICFGIDSVLIRHLFDLIVSFGWQDHCFLVQTGRWICARLSHHRMNWSYCLLLFKTTFLLHQLFL